jgi:hypothetical protein
MEQRSGGVVVSALDSAGVLAGSERAEQMGIPAAWLTTGGIGLDASTLFAVAAVRTSRMRLGMSITPTFPRHPLNPYLFTALVYVVASMATRTAVLQEPSHRLRLVSTPTQTSRRNQVEIWGGILGRRLLKRARFSAIAEIRQRVLAGVASCNITIAKPLTWTDAGRPFVA